MASGDGIIPENATVYITDTNVDPSSLASSDAVTAEVTNYSDTGGEEDVESRQVFGGGNIDLEKPRTQIEVSFDVIMRYGTDVTKWDEYKWGTSLDSSGSASKKRIYIEWYDGSSEYYTRAYDQAKGVTFEPESPVDDFLTGTMTFKLSPTDADGNANFQVAKTAATTLSW